MKNFEAWMKGEKSMIEDSMQMNERYYKGLPLIYQQDLGYKNEYERWNTVCRIRLNHLPEYTESGIAYTIYRVMQDFERLGEYDRYGIIRSFSNYYNSDYHDKSFCNDVMLALDLTLSEADSIFTLANNEVEGKDDKMVNDYIHNKLVNFVNDKLGTKIPTTKELEEARNTFRNGRDTLSHIKLKEMQYRAGFYYNRSDVRTGTLDNGILECDSYYIQLQEELRQEESPIGNKTRR